MNYRYLDYGICIDTDMISSMLIDVYIGMETCDRLKDLAYSLSFPNDKLIRALCLNVTTYEFDEWLSMIRNECPNPKNLPIFNDIRDIAEVVCLEIAKGIYKRDELQCLEMNYQNKRFSSVLGNLS
jgi:hypothetical protein